MDIVIVVKFERLIKYTFVLGLKKIYYIIVWYGECGIDRSINFYLFVLEVVFLEECLKI